MIRPSVQTRHALARLTLPATVAASFGLMLVGKVDTVLVERARTAVYDASAPIYAVLAEPIAQMHAAVSDVAGLWELRREDARSSRARMVLCHACSIGRRGPSRSKENGWSQVPRRVLSRPIFRSGRSDTMRMAFRKSNRMPSCNRWISSGYSITD